jgi:phosphoglycolate phosphatase-like HAD superfamily hydrolase
MGCSIVRRAVAALLLAALVTAPLALSPAARAQSEAAPDPLPSWTEGATKAAILNFVAEAVREGGPDFVPVPERIATFDNDGTLWSEQPVYFQAEFALDRVRALAPQHPEWATTEPFRSILTGDRTVLADLGEQAFTDLLAATHAGMTVEDFEGEVKRWLATARHPRFDRPYDELIYQPMLELLAHLRANGFKTYIVSGGGLDFMRAFAEATYGIPPEQVIGSSVVTAYRLDGETPTIVRLPEVDFIDDGPGKAVGIQRVIGRRPVFAAGNSDGDLQMLQWTTMRSGPAFGLIVHHTDAAREWAYDAPSVIGQLKEALIQAPERGWTVVDMKTDWKVIYPFERR